MTPTWVCADSLEWLIWRRHQCGAIVSSPPDAAELGMDDLEQYADWLTAALRLCFAAATPGCPCVFYVTDRLHGGRWLSKPQLVGRVAHEQGFGLLWHKVVLRREVGAVDLHRPTYAHLVAYGDASCRPGRRSSDVLAWSRATYSNGTPQLAVVRAVDYVAEHSSVGQLTDPFCGQGAIPKYAAAWGLLATGVDIDPAMIAVCDPPQEVLL